MIDIRLLRKRPNYYKKKTREKGYSEHAIDEVLALDTELRFLISSEEKLRSERKRIATSDNDRERAREIKLETKELVKKRRLLEDRLQQRIHHIPNPAFDLVPHGKTESDNIVLRKWGEPRDFHFVPKDHLELGSSLKILDFEAGAKVAGTQTYYLDNEGALLELALIQFTLQVLVKKGFTPTITPDLARSRFYLGTGYAPKGRRSPNLHDRR